MWLKENNLENKGRNIWIYRQNELVFAGVELEMFGCWFARAKTIGAI